MLEQTSRFHLQNIMSSHDAEDFGEEWGAAARNANEDDEQTPLILNWRQQRALMFMSKRHGVGS